MPVKFKIKVVQIGNSLRMTIPQEIVEALKIRKGDTVLVSLTNTTMLVEKSAE